MLASFGIIAVPGIALLLSYHYNTACYSLKQDGNAASNKPLYMRLLTTDLSIKVK